MRSGVWAHVKSHAGDDSGTLVNKTEKRKTKQKMHVPRDTNGEWCILWQGAPVAQ